MDWIRRCTTRLVQWVQGPKPEFDPDDPAAVLKVLLAHQPVDPDGHFGEVARAEGSFSVAEGSPRRLT